MEKKLKQYCDIRSCINSQGTKSLELNFFRVSKDGEKKRQWVTAIEKHQSIDKNVKSLSICSLHFEKEDFKNEYVLHKNSLPTIFEIVPEIDPGHHGPNNGNLSKFNDSASEIAIVDENGNNLAPCSSILSRMSDSASELKIIDRVVKSPTAYLEQTILELRKNLLDKEMALYKANNKIIMLECKLNEKGQKYALLYQQSHYYKKQYEKLRSENNDESNQNSDVDQIINCLTGKSKMKYSKAVRQFALTIDFYSPKAYRYIREKFNRCLPHPTTLKKYYVNSGANGEPGISSESIGSLRSIVNDFDKTGNKFYCALTFDEMFIRPHVQYIDAQKKFQGFITYGERQGNDLPVAENVIVFMANGLNKAISLPVAHHFIKALNKQEKANLLESVITAVSETGSIIVNVTCDGLATNLSMFRHLGASFDPDDMRPHIKNSLTGDKIYTMLDACHMLKLARNGLMNHGVLYDGENEAIKWDHFIKLENARANKEFVQHKLNKQHIECQNKKMSVILAAQTLSGSVSNALEFLMNAEKPDFQDCAGTIKYTRQINDLFDILNTGFKDKLEHNGNKKFKVPLCPATAEHIIPFLDKSIDYIRSLKLNGTNILKSSIKTGFLGFIMDITAVKSIYSEYVETGKLVELATFHQSQDPLESFFGRVRSKCGFNTSPTVEQFKAAYRKILINNEIEASIHANCIDNLKIYFVSSTQKVISTGTHIEEQNDEPQMDVEDIVHFTPNDNLFDAYQEATICKIASNIEQVIRNKANFQCDLCLNVLNENDKVSIDMLEKRDKPCASTVYLCKVAKKYLDMYCVNIRFDYANLIETIQKEIDYGSTFEKSDFSTHEDHKQYFIDFIVQEFIRIQATYIAKHLSLKERHKLKRESLMKKRNLRSSN